MATDRAQLEPGTCRLEGTKTVMAYFEAGEWNGAPLAWFTREDCWRICAELRRALDLAGFEFLLGDGAVETMDEEGLITHWEGRRFGSEMLYPLGYKTWSWIEETR